MGSPTSLPKTYGAGVVRLVVGAEAPELQHGREPRRQRDRPRRLLGVLLVADGDGVAREARRRPTGRASSSPMRAAVSMPAMTSDCRNRLAAASSASSSLAPSRPTASRSRRSRRASFLRVTSHVSGSSHRSVAVALAPRPAAELADGVAAPCCDRRRAIALPREVEQPAPRAGRRSRPPPAGRRAGPR